MFWNGVELRSAKRVFDLFKSLKRFKTVNFALINQQSNFPAIINYPLTIINSHQPG